MSKQIPLYGKGGKVVGHTLISDRDYALVRRYRFYIGKQGYATTSMVMEDGSRRNITLHQMLKPKKMKDGEWLVVDHKNCERLDNRRCNLRYLFSHENSRNAKRRSDNKTGFQCVAYRPKTNKYESYFYIKGHKIHVGIFDSAEEAYIGVQMAKKMTKWFPPARGH